MLQQKEINKELVSFFVTIYRYCYFIYDKMRYFRHDVLFVIYLVV